MVLRIEYEENDSSLIVRAIDDEIDLGGKPYSDWTAVSRLTLIRMVEVGLAKATDRLQMRHQRFIRDHLNPPSAAQLGRVSYGPATAHGISFFDVFRDEG